MDPRNNKCSIEIGFSAFFSKFLLNGASLKLAPIPRKIEIVDFTRDFFCCYYQLHNIKALSGINNVNKTNRLVFSNVS